MPEVPPDCEYESYCRNPFKKIFSQLQIYPALLAGEESRLKDFFFISVIDSRWRVVVIVGTPQEVGGGLLRHT